MVPCSRHGFENYPLRSSLKLSRQDRYSMPTFRQEDCWGGGTHFYPWRAITSEVIFTTCSRSKIHRNMEYKRYMPQYKQLNQQNPRFAIVLMPRGLPCCAGHYCSLLCFAQRRGLYLITVDHANLIEATWILTSDRNHCITINRIHLRKAASKRSKKLVIGKHALNALIKSFTDLDTSEQTQRWVRSWQGSRKI